MGKTITTSQLRTELTQLLNRLEQGESHFIITRKDRQAAVLLSIEKFRDIMQTLETLRTLEFIGEEQLNSGDPDEYMDLPLLQDLDYDESLNSDLRPEDLETDLEPPPLVSLPGNGEGEKRQKSPRTGTLEEAAARLGIRLIK
jgi:prevent-host-death family protein